MLNIKLSICLDYIECMLNMCTPHGLSLHIRVEYSSTGASEPRVGAGQWHGGYYPGASSGGSVKWGGWQRDGGWYQNGPKSSDPCWTRAHLCLQSDRLLIRNQSTYSSGFSSICTRLFHCIDFVYSNICFIESIQTLLLLYVIYGVKYVISYLHFNSFKFQIMKASLFAGDDDCDLFSEHLPSKLLEEVASPRLLLGTAQARLSGWQILASTPAWFIKIYWTLGAIPKMYINK